MPRENRCMYIAHACFYVCCSDCVGVCGNVCCVAAVVKNSVLSLGVLKYVVCLGSGCDGYCVFCLYCEAWSCRCLGMGSVSVLSCIWQFVNAGLGCKRRPYRRGILKRRSHNCFIGSQECLLLFTPSSCSECFYDL